MNEQEKASVKRFDKWAPRLCIVAALAYATTGWILIAVKVFSWIWSSHV